MPLRALRVTSSSPLICMNWRSSGVAMLLATVSGLARGSSLAPKSRGNPRRGDHSQEDSIAEHAKDNHETVRTAVMTGRR